MTSINAMRFDRDSGMMVCDEQRTWNPEQMSVNSCDKIRCVVPPNIQKRIGLVACYGHTGTSSIGDEINELIRKRIIKDFEEQFSGKGKEPEKFKTLEEVAELAYEITIEVKRKHIDEQLKGQFGFTASEFISGQYEKNGKKVEIKDKDIVNSIPKYLTWEGRFPEVTPVFLNAGVLAGYEPQEGFRIFLLSMIEPVCEPVQEIFLADGSGLDICDHLFTGFANSKSVPERRGNIDRVEGLAVMLEGLNAAGELCVGVGGYSKIIYINGAEKDRAKILKEIEDYRSKLASEIVMAKTKGFIDRDLAFNLLDNLIFKDQPFWEINNVLFEHIKEKEKFKRLLRGYRN